METETQSKSSTPTTSPWVLPAAIIVGFSMIAAAIYFTGNQDSTAGQANPQNAIAEANEDIRPLDNTDHIRGNPNAQIMMVEYSDYECPFCKQFHDTMNSIMDDYGTTGQVAWAYRHMPFVQLHPNAVRIAVASECVAELAGNEAFWEFSDLVFEERGLQELTDMSKLNGYATLVGVDVTEFTTCLETGRHIERVEADLRDALAAGAKGTPYTVLLIGDQQAVINGAQPYNTVKNIIDTLLAQIDTTRQ